MQSMVLQVLGHVSELGFGSGELLAWLAQSWITLATEPGADPRHMSDYRHPVTNLGLAFFQTWTEVSLGYPSSWRSSWESNLTDLEHGYSIFAIAAISFIYDQPGGSVAWKWAYDNGYKKVSWSKNPKMAILPRLSGD